LLQNLQDSGGGHAEKSFLERFFGAKSRKLFGHAEVNQLVQGNTFGFRQLARLRLQRRLQAQRITGFPLGSVLASFSVRAHRDLVRPGDWKVKCCSMARLKTVRTKSSSSAPWPASDSSGKGALGMTGWRRAQGGGTGGLAFKPSNWRVPHLSSRATSGIFEFRIAPFTC
jgi:hypothetical protein